MDLLKGIDERRMRSNFSGHARQYDQYAVIQKRVIERLRQQLAAVTVKAGPVLDIGTGTGALAEAFRFSYPAAPIIVMDIAHGMTRQASARLVDVGACDGDACALPFRSAAFQTVISSSVYQWVRQLPTAFCEVSRILRTGGLFAVALFGEQTLWELKACHRQAVAEGHNGRESHVQSFPRLHDVASALRTAGLHCLAIETFPDVDYHADVPALLRQLKQIGASNAAKDRPRGLSSRRVMQDMMALYEADYRCAAGLPATYEVIMALASKP